MSEEQIKNKELTKQKLTEAFEKILSNEGFQKLGINSVAKEAGVSKVLIYRYFGDFNGLVRSFLEEKAYWLKQNDEIFRLLQTLRKEEISAGASAMFKGMYDELLNSEIQREIRRWELAEMNEALDEVCNKTEEPSADRNKLMSEKTGIDEDILAGIIAILIGGLTYLALRAKTALLFNDVSLRDPKGQEKINKSVDFIFQKLLD